MRHSVFFQAIQWLVLTSLVQCAAAAPMLEQTTLFQSGDAGYVYYRIPSLAVTTHGTVLAFTEGHKNSSDTSDIDLMLRRSQDGGRTWSEVQCVADGGTHVMGNPCPVVDQTTGTIWMPYRQDLRTVLLTKSTDDGLTWSTPIDITQSATPPGAFDRAPGPGHGIQLNSGRLVIPGWFDSTATSDQIQSSYAFYSDDHGATWKVGQPLTSNASDECEAVQLADGRLYMTGRSRLDLKQRAYALSSDGGETWSPVRNDPSLLGRGSAAGVLRFTDAVHDDRNRILLAASTDPGSDPNKLPMVVSLSYDETDTWPVSKFLTNGFSGYADLAVTDDHNILCLYEADNMSQSLRRIVLARFNLEWLTDGKDSILTAEPSTLVVLAMGVIGLLAYGWRKRR
jgi:sialidase-1